MCKHARVLSSATTAIRSGTLLAWSIKHTSGTDDPIAKAWSRCRDAVAMRTLLIAIRHPAAHFLYRGHIGKPRIFCDRVAPWTEFQGTPTAEEFDRVYPQDHSWSGCQECIVALRAVVPTITLDEVVDAHRRAT